MNNNQYNAKFHVKQEKTTSKYCKNRTKQLNIKSKKQKM